VRVRTDGQETCPAVPSIEVHQRYFRSVHEEFFDGGIKHSKGNYTWTGANSLAALWFANRFGSRRMALKPRLAMDSERGSGNRL